MATCKECFYYKHCGGFLPSDLDKDVWHYCAEGRADEIPDVDKRCTSFKDKSAFVSKRKYDRLQKELDAAITIAKSYKKKLDSIMDATEKADKVEVVRCKNCTRGFRKFLGKTEVIECQLYHHDDKRQYKDPMAFCSSGVRREENGKMQ